MRNTLNIWDRRIILFLFLLPIARLEAQYGGSFAKSLGLLDGKKASFLLTKLTYDADIPFASDEFLYLTGLKVDSFVTRQDVDAAYRALSAKRRFAHIDIDSEDYLAGKHLHFKLVGNWILKKLDFSGIWFGKQTYMRVYAQHPGDVFDASLHEESVKALRTKLLNQGYFDCAVNDEIIYRKKRKTIVAKITVKRRTRFTIGSVGFDVKHQDTSIVQHLNKRLRERFSREMINASYRRIFIEKQVGKIKAYLKEKGFAHIRISLTKELRKDAHEVDLVFVVALGQKRVLNFSGNTVFTSQQIRENILGDDQPDWLFSPDVISEQIRHEYYKKGYWDAILQEKKIDDVGYEIIIHEGAATQIDSVEVKDFVTGIPEPDVPFWNDLLAQRTFDEDMLDQGVDKLKKHYYAMGYWDFKVVEKRFVKNEEAGDYTIQFLVDKGIQRLFGGVEVEGFHDLEEGAFFKKYRLSSTGLRVPFNYDWLSEQRGYLIAHFQKLNYWYVDVQPDLRIKSEESQKSSELVTVVWKVQLGEQVSFGKVFLRGTTRLPFKRILREINFKEGEVWDKKKIDLTRKKLKRLDIFKTVQIQPFQIPQNQGEKPVLLTLVDDDALEMRLRLGYYFMSSNFMIKRQPTPKVGASFIIRNPTNQADKLSFDGDWNRYEGKLDVDYQIPSFFNRSIISKVKGYASKYNQPVRIRQSNFVYGATAYKAYQSGFLFGFNDEYKRDYHWGVSFGNDWIRTTNVHGYINLDRSMQNYTLPYFFVEPSLIIDKLDDRAHTKKGGFTIASLKLMAPEERGGELSAKLTAEQSLFYPIVGDFIIAAHARVGYIFRRAFDKLMPIERFYLGGPYSVRGYEIDSLPPLGVTDTNKITHEVIRRFTINRDMHYKKQKNVVREYAIQGGSSMINANIEFRFPIYKDFGGVAFQDIGVLSQTGFAGFKNVWFPASGVGLRYKTPIGPIRFDLGFKWKRRFKRDCPYTFHLTVGEVF